MQPQDLMKVFEERCGWHVLLIASQIPNERWHEYIRGGALADAILNHLLQGGHGIIPTAAYMRESTATLTDRDRSE